MSVSAYHDCGQTVVTVDDDGLPVLDVVQLKETGIDFELVKALATIINSEAIFPTVNRKKFEIRILQDTKTYAA